MFDQRSKQVGLWLGWVMRMCAGNTQVAVRVVKGGEGGDGGDGIETELVLCMEGCSLS